MKQKTFFIIFKGISLKQIKKKKFLEEESPTLSLEYQVFLTQQLISL